VPGWAPAIEDCVDEAGAGARWQVPCFHSQSCSHHAGSARTSASGEDSTVVLDRDVLEVARHVEVLPCSWLRVGPEGPVGSPRLMFSGRRRTPKGAMSRFGRDSRVLLRAKEASEGLGTGCGHLPGGLGELGDVAVAVSGC